MNSLTRVRSLFIAATMLAATATATATAAPPVPGGQPQAATSTLATLPVQVDVVLTRWQGDKKVSSLPFTLMTNAAPRGSGNGSTGLRMGVDVPVGTSTSNVTQTSNATSANPRAVETTKSETVFRNVGTNIDTSVTRLDEANFSVYVYINDSSVFSSDPSKLPAGADPAAFRTFNSNNTLSMKDGQTRLFGVATDKITGETLRIEVKLTVLK